MVTDMIEIQEAHSNALYPQIGLNLFPGLVALKHNHQMLPHSNALNIFTLVNVRVCSSSFDSSPVRYVLGCSLFLGLTSRIIEVKH